MRTARTRTGVTLLETVIVLGIVALLIALTLPALQKVRESANLTTCGSRLRQVALAAHAFHADFARLPPGYLGPSKAREMDYPAFFNEGQWVGHLPMLMPYLLDQKPYRALAKSVRFEVDYVAQQPWWRTPTGDYPNVEAYAAARTIEKLFLCPSVPSYSVPIGMEGRGTVVGIHVYHSDRGRGTPYWLEGYERSPEFHALARTQYIGVAGAGSGSRATDAKYEGVLTNRSVNSLGQIAALDGTSNTLMYGECCGSRAPDRGVRLALDISWAGGGALGTFNGLARGQGAPIDTFSSLHPAGVNFAMADGAVRRLRHDFYRDSRGISLSWHVLQQLAGMRDAEACDASQFMD